MDGKKRATANLVIFGLLLLVGPACPMLLPQTPDTKPATKGTEPTILKCDSSVMNPVPGESIADAARRVRARKNCEDAMKSAAEHMVKRVDVENGHLVVGAVVPGLGRIPGLLNVNRLDVYVRNSSPVKHEYTLIVRCGMWSQTKSDSVGPSGPSKAEQGLGKSSFSFDVSPPCNLMDVALKFSSPDEIKGEPRQASASVVPGVSDDEMAQRLRSLQGSPRVQGTAGTSIPDLQRRVDEACKPQPLGELATGPVSSVGDHMTACAKAYDDLTAALKVQGEAQNKARTEALKQPVPSGVVVVRLTGTEGLPFSGTCSYSNRAGTVSKSYDEVAPFQATMNNVDNVNCSFVSKSDFHHELKLEIIKDGRVTGESDTDAPYGVVGVARDVN